MRKIKIELYFKWVFWLVGISSLLIILYFRFQESITRVFGPDEYHHLHYAYLVTSGKRPFVDFANIYSPVFALTLYPIFKILGESFSVLILSRLVVFFYLLISLIFTYLIGRILGDKYLGLTALMIAVSVPLSLEKVIEIRPDNLMIPLTLMGIYFFLKGIQINKKWAYLFSGIFFSLSFLVLIKIAFTIGAFFIAMIPFIASNRTFKKKIISGIFYSLSAFILVLVVFIILSAIYGILPQAVKSILFDSRTSLSTLRFGYELNPFFWFKPNTAVYVDYNGFTWWINNLILFLSGLGIVSLFFPGNRKINSLRFLLLFPALSSYFYLFIIWRPYQQYYLPFLSLIPFFGAIGMEFIASFFGKWTKAAEFILLSILFILLTKSVWLNWQVRKTETNVDYRKPLEWILQNTKKTDAFWGGEGHYIFRPDGYFVYSDKFIELPDIIKKRYPPFIPTLEKRQTKYIMVNMEAMINKTWPYDQVDNRPFAEWVINNFKSTDYPGIWVRK